MAPNLETLPDLEPGWVWLAGAGPGDPGLISLLTYRGLSRADVVVHDALVGRDILSFARVGATLEFAGKRGGKPSPEQRDISRRLVELARAGKRVLRLKGGDPFIFGRGAEEALALVAEGVPFRVVPGITAGVGGLAYAGIPATHRDTNSAVTFVTAHSTTGEVPDGIDWSSLATGSPALVIYMPLRHVGKIQDVLLASGRPADEPAAVISQATLPEQRVVETTLENLSDMVAAHHIETPALLVIGEIVRLRAGLDWLGAMAGRALQSDPLTREGGDKAPDPA